MRTFENFNHFFKMLRGIWCLGTFLQGSLFVAIARTEEVFNTTPPPFKTNFSCSGKSAGFYADVNSNCKVYHTCDDYGNKFSYRCPEETAFRQDALICDHAHLVDCRSIVFSHTKEETVDKRDNERKSYSRSFHVVQQPSKAIDKVQLGFVFSSSVFLRDFNDEIEKKLAGSGRKTKTSEADGCNFNEEKKNVKNNVSTLTGISVDSKRDFNSFTNFHQNSRSQSEVVSRQSAQKPTLKVTNTESGKKSMESTGNPFTNNRDYPYSETLRSIQANSRTTSQLSVTEIPVHALTLSLKPLVPNELEYDPYYPKSPTSTEAYYTPSEINGKEKSQFRSSTHKPWSIHFEIPDVIPDLNSLEDLVDRRKLFYIPRIKA